MISPQKCDFSHFYVRKNVMFYILSHLYFTYYEKDTQLLTMVRRIPSNIDGESW